MTNLIRSALGVATLSLFSMAYAGPPSVNPEPMDLDADLQAKIMKEKSKRDTSLIGGSGSSSKDCGTVNINSNNDKKSNSGFKDMFGKQSTTIVTGPVINMDNCK